MALRGYIDGVIGGELVGWAFDEDRPALRLLVQCELDGAVLGTVEASDWRGDLASAGVGDGGHGFRAPLGESLLGPGDHTVRASVDGTDLPLAPDWIVRDGADRDVDDVRLETAQSSAAGRQARTPRIVEGVAGWWFELPGDGGTLTHARLDAEQAAHLEFEQAVEAAGGTGLAVLIPGKRWLYAEHLRDDDRSEGALPGRRLAARIRLSGQSPILDLTDALEDARSEGRVYSRTGQRLSWVGALHAAREIVLRLPPHVDGLEPLDLTRWDFGPLDPVEEPLTGAPEDTEPTIVPPPAAPSVERPTAVVVHDGCGARIAEVLGASFDVLRTVVAGTVEQAMLAELQPQIVLWLREPL